MKKKLFLLLFAALLVFAAACGNGDTEGETTDLENIEESDSKAVETDGENERPDAGTTNAEEADTNEEDSGGQVGNDAEDILLQSHAAMEALQSYSMEMEMTQHFQDDGEAMSIESVTQADYITDPLAIYMYTDSHDPTFEESMVVEMYVTPEDIYMYEPESDGWLSLPPEMQEEMMQMEERMGDTTQELEIWLEFADEFSVSDEENHYILTLTASGDEYRELIDAQMADMFGGGDPMLDQMMAGMEIGDINYEVHIDKETYYYTQVSMNMESSMSIEDQSISIEQEFHSTFDRFDEIDEIIIPDQVVDEAEELDLSELQP